MNIPTELRYAASHEWAKNENGTVRVGVSDHAQHEITDVVHVELPAVGKTVEQGQPCAVVESVKAAFDIYAPVSGTIIAVNEKLSGSPELVNQSPYKDGFFFVIKASDITQLNALMSADDYQKNLAH
ncbi:MAG: glycine cleavage system protein GcvH [Elusimicrobia bacterium]|nr:glycine cleavage system protein GcvH [Elusimicrobiota bacterium]